MNDLLLISSSSTFREIFSTNARSYPDLISKVYTIPSFLEEWAQKDDTIIIADGSELQNASLDALLISSIRTPIIVVKESFAPNEVYRLLKSGVKGLVSFEECTIQFLDIIHTIQNGDLYLGKEQVNNLFNDIRNSISLEVLSTREREILPLMMRGLTFYEIALQLNISYETIKSHSKNIYKKLNVKTKRELLKYDFNN